MVKEISRWQNRLWTFGHVGHIGKVGGPRAWQESISPLVTRQDVRVNMPESEDGEITLYLMASNAGNDEPRSKLVWHQPRFVVPDAPISR